MLKAIVSSNIGCSEQMRFHNEMVKNMDKPLWLCLPAMDEDTRIIDIEAAIIEDRELKWNYHNPTLINKMISYNGAVRVMARCFLPDRRCRIQAPSLDNTYSIHHPIEISDLAYHLKKELECGMQLYKNGEFGSFEIYLTLKTTEPNK